MYEAGLYEAVYLLSTVVKGHAESMWFVCIISKKKIVSKWRINETNETLAVCFNRENCGNCVELWSFRVVLQALLVCGVHKEAKSSDWLAWL